MTVGGGDVDAPGEDPLAMARVLDRQPAGAAQDVRQYAAARRREVLND